MMEKKLFGTSGIRRLSGEFTETFIARLAGSLSCYLGGCGRVAVGRDSRPSSASISMSFIESLNLAGLDVVDIGLASTPTLALASEDTVWGVEITASHNPPQWNGFKFWKNGRAFSPSEEKAVEAIFFNDPGFSHAEKKGATIEKDYAEKHIERIVNYVGKADAPVRILVDCANGAGAAIAPGLFEALGFDAVLLNTETAGVFAHGLEPTQKNLASTCDEVRAKKADLGVVFDGDADRAAVISHDGVLVDWDDFLAILAYGKENVVTTVDASMRIDAVCSKVTRTPIGDVAVADSVCREGADFGGEPSGSMIFPQVHLFPDGLLAGAIAASMVSRGVFYEILEKIPDYPAKRIKIFSEKSDSPRDQMPGIKSAILERFRDRMLALDETDGVRLSLPGGWVLVRPSGTEPCIRITAEAKGEGLLDALVRECEECIRRFI